MIPWSRKWQPTPIFLHGKFHGQKSMEGYSTLTLKSLSHVQLCNPMDCSLPDSSVHGIFQARVLEWIAISFSRRSSQPRDRTWASRIVGRRVTVWATREVPGVLGYSTWDHKELDMTEWLKLFIFTLKCVMSIWQKYVMSHLYPTLLQAWCACYAWPRMCLFLLWSS